MKVRRVAAMLFLVVLLVVANEAKAACAWVLWVQDDRLEHRKDRDPGQQQIDWELIGASSSEADCQRKLKDTIERVTNPEKLPDEAKVMYKVEGDTVHFLFFPKNGKPTDTNTRSQTLHYFCLPDTVDPRNPKAR